MKKILFSLVALVCSMSMNAQVMKVMKGNTVVAEYPAEQADNVVFEAIPLGTAYAQRTGGIYVKCVQLWENGPKFAEYNVGVTDGKAESYGGYYCWGKSADMDYNNYKDGTDVLTGDDDTAIKLWGSKWRMPTKEELDALLANCDVVWTDNYKESGVKGSVFTGKVAPYNSNSVFLPAAGQCNGVNNVGFLSQGFYWSSTPDVSDKAQRLKFNSDGASVNSGDRRCGYFVRAVLVE